MGLIGRKNSHHADSSNNNNNDNMGKRILQKSFFFLQALIACDYVDFDISVPTVQYLLPSIISFLDVKDDVLRASCQDFLTRYNALIFTMCASNTNITVAPGTAAGYSSDLKENLLIKCQVMKRLLASSQQT